MSGAMSGPCRTDQPRPSSQARAAYSTIDSVNAIWLLSYSNDFPTRACHANTVLDYKGFYPVSPSVCSWLPLDLPIAPLTLIEVTTQLIIGCHLPQVLIGRHFATNGGGLVQLTTNFNHTFLGTGLPVSAHSFLYVAFP